jgi:hypothetical protein
MHSFTWLLATGVLCSTSWSQGIDFGARGPRPDVARPAPERNASTPMLPPGATLGTNAGSGVVESAILDDSIPLPIAAAAETTPQGDVRRSPASGDPYFLSFAGGTYAPPSGERIDPALLAALQSVYPDGRPSPTAYAFVMFDRRITPGRLAELELAGARVLGFHPWYAVKIAVPPMLLDQVAALPFVHWVGVARPIQKLHPELAKLVLQSEPGASLDVYVSVFDSDLCAASTPLDGPEPVLADRAGERAGAAGAPSATRVRSNGWQERALERAGVVVDEYVDGLRTFHGKVPAALVRWLADLDFVQFVEADLPPTPNHDESTTMVYTDLIREYTTGGSSQTVVSGQLDSGLDYTHSDMWFDGVGWDFSGSGTGPWHDGCGHGTHVGGTIMGRGVISPQLRGNAPGLADLPYLRHFHLKIFDDACNYGGATMANLMVPVSSSYFDGTYTTQRPQVLNNSWGTCCGTYYGSEAEAREIDNQVYSTGQLWVWSSSNSGVGAINIEGGAKNAFTVGSVNDYYSGAGDPSVLSSFSGQGPTGDGRWKPNVVAPGDWIESLLAHSSTGYTHKYGTSMAVPHVVGVSAMLLDSATYMQYAAERAEAQLMATALTKNDATLTYPSDTHLDQYGAGRVDSYRALYGTSQTTWLNWGGYLSSSNWTYGDFTVPSGATRIVVCMNYTEPAASAGAGHALVSNYDLWIDADPIDPAGNTGDYFVQQSTLDNTEIRTINLPAAGSWRWKIYPTSATTGMYWGVSVAIVTGDTTPALGIAVAANDYTVKPNAPVHVDVDVTNPSFVASAVYLDSATSAAISGSHKTLGNSLDADMGGVLDMELGNLMHGWTRHADYDVSWATEGLRSFVAQARADNASSATQTIYVTVDGTAPTLPTGLHSTSHSTGVWSNDTSVDFAWTASTDNLSGVSGYGVAIGTSSPVAPAEVQDIGAVTSYTQSFSSSAAGNYFSLKPVDYCGNWNASYVFAGPYFVDAIAPTLPSGFSSPTHHVGVKSCNATVTVQWVASSDAHSGLKGYVYAWDHASTTDLTGVATNLGAGVTSRTQTLASSTSAYYFHLASVDNASNWCTTQHYGPFYVDTNPVNVTACPPKVNSAGCTPAIAWSGAPIVGQTSGFVVSCSNILTNKNGVLFYGLNGSASIPFQGGTLCVAGPQKRTQVVNSGGTGGCTGVLHIDFSAYSHGLLGGTPPAALLVPGTTVHMQWWSRDPGYAPPNSSSLSGSLRVVTCE